MRPFFKFSSALLMLALPSLSWGQAVDVTDLTSESKSGRERAAPYFQNRRAPASSGTQEPSRAPSSELGGTPRYLAIHVGRMFADQSYKWGPRNETDVGGLNAGVTYRLGEWVNSMDFAMRVDYTHYSLPSDSARKLSFSGIVTFPDANSHFPLYFGGGLGAGLFLKQLNNESVLALDYQLLAGARFLNVFNNMGLMFEAGIKNHIFLLSDGQYNGVFINVGTVFAF